MIDVRQARHVVEQKECMIFFLFHPKGDENLIRVLEWWNKVVMIFFGEGKIMNMKEFFSMLWSYY
jgi:hypothetical protein